MKKYDLHNLVAVAADFEAGGGDDEVALDVELHGTRISVLDKLLQIQTFSPSTSTDLVVLQNINKNVNKPTLSTNALCLPLHRGLETRSPGAP